MITGERVVIEARTWVGTPFYHLGRERGRGVDCLGLVLGVATALGLYDKRYVAYAVVPGCEYVNVPVLDLLRAEAEQVQVIEPGVIAYLNRLGMPHFAFLDGHGHMIHANAGVGRVVETSYDERWRRRTQAFFRFRGL